MTRKRGTEYIFIILIESKSGFHRNCPPAVIPAEEPESIFLTVMKAIPVFGGIATAKSLGEILKGTLLKGFP